MRRRARSWWIELTESRLHREDTAPEIHQDDGSGALRAASQRLVHTQAVRPERLAGPTADGLDPDVRPCHLA